VCCKQDLFADAASSWASQLSRINQLLI